MKRETLPPVRRVPLLLLALLLLPLASCLTPESVDCPPDLVCPAGQRCAANAPVCIKDDCGDGIRQASETCDDGNIEEGDGCNKTCTSDESCGNGTLDIMTMGGVSRREACDDGNTTDGDGCSADCLVSEFCGNGVVDKASREACDDGNNTDEDGCSADCVSNERCGNGIVDHAVGEVCDDGNTTNGDHCSANCRSGENCGNGIRDADEQCDDGNTSDEDNCLTTCVFATCGDGAVDKEVPRIEQCDVKINPAACNFNCTPSKCGDGIVNTSAGEQCDDSNSVDTDGCANNCQIAWCGDGVKNGTEECDPGIDPSCNYNCTSSRCGDGIVNAKNGEVCDDGNNNDCGTCNLECTKRQDVSRATGRIIGVPYSALHDGETFTFNEGRTDKLVFEFDKRDGLKNATHIRVDIDNRSESDLTAEAIQNTINYLFKYYNFEWYASDRLWNVVMLEHRNEGRIDANKNITSGVSVQGFIVGITSHGSGYDCPADTGCSGDKDCKSRKCSIPPGQIIGTCQPE